MSFSFSLGVLIGCVCGVFSTVTLIGFALAVKEHNNKNQIEQEDTTEHE